MYKRIESPRPGQAILYKVGRRLDANSMAPCVFQEKADNKFSVTIIGNIRITDNANRFYVRCA